MGSDNTLFGPTNQPNTLGRQDENLDGFIDNWKHYKDGLMIFLGAGASMGAACRAGRPLPTALGLRDELWSQFMLGEAEQKNPSMLGLLSLEHSTALIEAKVGRGPLVSHVGKRFTVTSPLWPHAALPFFDPKAIYTTNYDELVELGWQYHTDRPRIAPIYSAEQQTFTAGFTPLYKPHGTAQHSGASVGSGGIVLTQFDYFQMLESKRKMLHSFLNQMQDCCVVFIGYSFQDMDIASMLHAMRKRNRDRHWYAVFPRADSNVKAMYEREYGIKQIGRTFADFVAEAGSKLGLVPPGWHVELACAPRDT